MVRLGTSLGVSTGLRVERRERPLGQAEDLHQQSAQLPCPPYSASCRTTQDTCTMTEPNFRIVGSHRLHAFIEVASICLAREHQWNRIAAKMRDG
ncbi:hypothetical protein CBOM_07811 [Ceraceosorus bombacis]|uniref:Uncharacterized protein n=1 Tax=Ceraceosorus bombacis TaxID=401625 RepID=A0A0P1BIU8_9BASI|nr:hypothetical protein CBOM_07811 [Ceraceosorus bombacis]